MFEGSKYILGDAFERIINRHFFFGLPACMPPGTCNTASSFQKSVMKIQEDDNKIQKWRNRRDEFQREEFKNNLRMTDVGRYPHGKIR